MTIATFLIVLFVVLLGGFAMVILKDIIIDYPKEQAAKEAWRIESAKAWEQKRKEREAFDKAAWEARKARMAG